MSTRAERIAKIEARVLVFVTPEEQLTARRAALLVELTEIQEELQRLMLERELANNEKRRQQS